MSELPAGYPDKGVRPRSTDALRMQRRSLESTVLMVLADVREGRLRDRDMPRSLPGEGIMQLVEQRLACDFNVESAQFLPVDEYSGALFDAYGFTQADVDQLRQQLGSAISYKGDFSAQLDELLRAPCLQAEMTRQLTGIRARLVGMDGIEVFSLDVANRFGELEGLTFHYEDAFSDAPLEPNHFLVVFARDAQPEDSNVVVADKERFVVLPRSRCSEAEFLLVKRAPVTHAEEMNPFPVPGLRDSDFPGNAS